MPHEEDTRLLPAGDRGAGGSRETVKAALFRLIAASYSVGNGALYSFALTHLIENIAAVFEKEFSETEEAMTAGACLVMMLPLMLHVYKTYLPRLQQALGEQGLTPWGTATGLAKGVATCGAVWSTLNKFSPYQALNSLTSSWFALCYFASESALFSVSDRERAQEVTRGAQGACCAFGRP